jgi:hypothetical protein
MKRSWVIFTALLICLTLCACGKCEHVWTQADCVNGSVCTLCGEAGESALGHDWSAATCEQPEICARCGQTQGEALGHAFGEWTLTKTDKTHSCTRCELTETEEIDEKTYYLHQIQGHWDLYMIQKSQDVLTAQDYLGYGMAIPYAEVEGSTLKLYLTKDSLYEFSLEFDGYEDGIANFNALLPDGTGIKVLLTNEESTYKNNYLLLGFSATEIVTMSKNEVENFMVEGVWWRNTDDDGIQYVELNQDGTFHADFGEKISGTWLITPAYGEQIDNDMFYDGCIKLSSSKNGEQVSFIGEYSYALYELDDTDGEIDWDRVKDNSHLSIPFNENDLWPKQFFPVASMNMLEEFKKVISEQESKPVGSWRSTGVDINWDEKVETTAYSATFFEDGTFTMQLDEEITGTWSFNNTEFYRNGGYQVVYITEGTPFEIAGVNWYSDRGLSFFYMQTVDGENYIHEVCFAPEAE